MEIAEQQRNMELTALEAESALQAEQDKADAGKLLASVNSALGNSTGFNAMTGGTSGFASRVAGAFRRGAVGATGGAVVGSVVPAVGTVFGGSVGLIGGAVSGYKNVEQAQTSFANDIDFITSGNIIERLKEIRATGSWSGPMTDRDIEIIGQSSQKLNAMWDKDKRQFKGNINPQEVQTELVKLQSTMAKILTPAEQNDAVSKLFN
jgi:hypothetical protein